jgi:hypothetical protein
VWLHSNWKKDLLRHHIQMSAMDIPGGRTQILKVRQIRRINDHAVESDEDSAPQCISDTEVWRNRNGDLDNPNPAKMIARPTLNLKCSRDNSIEDPESP